jgi:hypothetical protein
MKKYLLNGDEINVWVKDKVLYINLKLQKGEEYEGSFKLESHMDPCEYCYSVLTYLECTVECSMDLILDMGYLKKINKEIKNELH